MMLLSRSAAAAPRSHALLHHGSSSLPPPTGRDIDDTDWRLFWGQEAQYNVQKLRVQRAHTLCLSQQLDAMRSAAATIKGNNQQLAEQVTALEDTLHWMLAHPVTYISRRPPLPSSTHAIRAQLTALQQQRSNHHETLAGLRHELDVLADTPVGALGRMLEGDTTIEELHAAEQRLTLELEARRERTAAQKQLLSELCADLARLESLRTAAEHAGGLTTELSTAHCAGAATAQEDDAQQHTQPATSVSRRGSWSSTGSSDLPHAASSSSNSGTTASACDLASNSLDTLTQDSSLTSEHSLLDDQDGELQEDCPTHAPMQALRTPACLAVD